MKRLALALLALVLAAAAFLAGRRYEARRPAPAAESKGGRRILYYVDPMHPAYRSDKPGIAPDCGMRLEPVYADEVAAPSAPKGRVLYYRDPQDHRYTSDKPGLNPETGNDLEPVYEQPPPGSIRISTEKQQLIGVRYETVAPTAGSYSFRAQGKVAADETRISRVQTRFEGWIDQLHVSFVGQAVAKGQPLLSVYSPELVASQQEYLLALKAREVLSRSTVSGARGDSDSLLEAARMRLRHWDLTAEQIATLERTGRPIRSITIYSPAAGFVTARNAFPNQKISPETELYTLVDLSRVWILADVFESEASLVRLGQSTVVTVPYSPGRRFAARVSYILPQVDPQTRTLKVRLEAANPSLLLKPEMFVDVEFAVPLPARITVPDSAVLDGGLTKTVFVDRGEGHFEPRSVETGRRLGDRVEILKGLTAGERIVTSGTFLLNSESQLKAAAAGMAPPAGEHKHD